MADFLGVTLQQFDISPLEGFYRETYGAVAKSASRSVRRVGEETVKKARAQIAASGKFRGPWVSGLRAKYYPKGGKPSANAKARINHRFGGLASVHEFGATIQGRPLLWLPIQGAGPKRTTLGADFGAGRIDKMRVLAKPKAVSEARGGLQYIKPKGGRPMLGVKTGTGKRARIKPMFVGVPRVTVKPRWGITPILEAGAARLDAEFLQQFDKTGV